MYLVIGYTGYNWSLNARWFALVFMRFMITIYTKRIKFIPEANNNTRWFIINLSKHFGLWARKGKDELGISLGFLSIYLARNKELAVFMGA